MATNWRSSAGTLGITSDQAELFHSRSHFQDVMQRLHKRMDLCDVVLIVGRTEKHITAHRLILIAFSDYFSDLLSEPMCDPLQWEITLTDVDGDAMGKLINYCYTGNLELRRDSIEALLTTALQLRLGKVVEACCDFLQHHLNPMNCLRIDSFAEKLHLKASLKKIRTFICDNFEEVVNQPDFLLVDAQKLSEYIAVDDLRVPSEMFIFEIIMKWIEYEPENRRKHFANLLAKVRLSLLPAFFVTSTVEPLCTTIESKDLVLQALKSHLMHTPISVKPRKSIDRNVVKHLLVINTRMHTLNGTLAVAGYNLRSNVWTQYNIPVKHRDCFKVAMMYESLIIAGGVSNGIRVKSVTSLNLLTMTSIEMGSLNSARRQHSVAMIDGSMYVIEGLDGVHCLHSVEKWDPMKRKWIYVASMTEHRLSPGVAVANNHIYVSGGFDMKGKSCKYLNSMECYHPIENVWRYTAPMKVGRRSHCLVVYNDYLFAIGGLSNDYITPVERYNPRTDIWTTISCPLNVCGSTKCTQIGDDIFICNQSKLYKVSFERGCERIYLQPIAPDASDVLKGFKEFNLVAIPYEFHPPNRIKSRKTLC